MWGSVYLCVSMQPMPIRMEDVVELGRLGQDCLDTTSLPLSRVCHCISASLASLSSHGETALMIMSSPRDAVLRTLLVLSEVRRRDGGGVRVGVG